MKPRSYLVLSGALFLLVAVAHLWRLVAGWDVLLAGRVVPRWVSVPGLIVPGLLSAWAFRLASKAS